MKILLILFSVLFSGILYSNNIEVQPKDSVAIYLDIEEVLDSTISVAKQRKNVRAKAIIFTILTGPLGGHRIYLRTRPGAPIIYSLTLGGFGILPLVDLAHLIFKKDISSFEKNPKIMMWTK